VDEHKTRIVENDDTIGWVCSCGESADYIERGEAEGGAAAHEAGEPDPYAQP
jgi:hypothetical protein